MNASTETLNDNLDNNEGYKNNKISAYLCVQK